METFNEILLKVQKEMPVVERNTKAYKYKYAPIEQVWEKVGKTINDNGFYITSEVSKEGIKSTAVHALGTLSSFIAFSKENLTAQERGSEITYARRYNLLAMFNIIVVGEDDDCQKENKPAEKPVEKPKGKKTAFQSAEDALNKCENIEALSKVTKKIEESKVLTDEEKTSLHNLAGGIYDSMTN